MIDNAPALYGATRDVIQAVISIIEDQITAGYTFIVYK